MKKYIVLALYVGALGNNILKAGDTAVEGNFPEGHADELVKSGHLREITEEEKKEAEALELLEQQKIDAENAALAAKLEADKATADAKIKADEEAAKLEADKATADATEKQKAADEASKAAKLAKPGQGK